MPAPPTQKERKSLVIRVALPCPHVQKLYVANQIAEPQSHDIAGMQTAPFVLCTLVISHKGRTTAKLEAILVAIKEAAKSIRVMRLKDEQKDALVTFTWQGFSN